MTSEQESIQVDERVRLTTEEAIVMLPDGDDIHTFRGGGMIVIGADWRRAAIVKAIEEHGAELSGEQATSMGHGLVLMDPTPLFIETKKETK